MQKLFSSQEGCFLNDKKHKERDLQNFIWVHQKAIFPEYVFIKQEFELKGSVRKQDGYGRIDILAFNPKNNQFVVIELKKGFNDNIDSQASEYRYYIEAHPEKIYVQVLDKSQDVLPKPSEISQKVEVVLIAEHFKPFQIHTATKQPKDLIRLITYHWYADAGDEYLVLDEVLGGNSSGKKLQKKESNQKKRDWHFYEKKTWNEVVESMNIKKWRERFQKVEFVKGNLDALSLLIAERDEENKRSGKWKKGFMRKRMKELLSELRENE